MRRNIMRVCFLALATFVAAGPVVRAVPFEHGGPIGSPEDQAMAYLKLNRPEQAVAVLKRALGKTPDSPRLHFHLGLAYAQQRKLELAEAEFRNVLQEDPDYVEANVQLAQLLVAKMSTEKSKAENLTLIEEAISQWRQAVDKRPHDTTLYYQLADTYVRSSQFRDANVEAAFDAAVEVLNEVKERAPQETTPDMALGNTNIRHAEFVADQTKFAELTGETAAKCNKLLDTAVAHFRKVLASDPAQLYALDRIVAVERARGKSDQCVKIIEEHITKLEKPEEKAACYRFIAQQHMIDKEFPTAAAAFQTAIETDPRDLASYLFLADLQRKDEAHEQAAETLAKSLETDPNFLNAYIELAQMALKRERPEEALEYFTTALNIPSDRAAVAVLPAKDRMTRRDELYTVAAIGLADILIGQSKFDEAAATLQKLAILIPSSPLPEFYTGEVYHRQGDYKAAKEHYRNALVNDRTFVKAILAMAGVSMTEAQLATSEEEREMLLREAVDQYEMALRLLPKNGMIFERLANLRASLAIMSKPADRPLLQQALVDITKAGELAPDSQVISSTTARILHELGQDEKAVAKLQEVIDRSSEEVDKAPDDVRAIFALADLRATLVSWRSDKAVLKQALDGFALVVEKNPEFLPAYLRAALMLEKEKDWKAAAEWFEKLLKAAQGQDPVAGLSGPRADNALYASAELAWLYCEYLDDIDRARKYVKIARELRPDLPSVLDTAGWIHYKVGEHAEAIQLLRRAYKSMPANATIGYHLGTALAASGDPAGAKEALETALRDVGDDADLTAKIKEALKTLKK